MTTYLYDPITDNGISGAVLTSNGPGTAPSFQVPPGAATVFYSGLTIPATNVTYTGSLVTLPTAANPFYFIAYKACTCYMVSFSIIDLNSTTASVTIQPYGSLTAGGTPGVLGTSNTKSVPSSGPYVTYQQAQTINLSAGGYLGMVASSTNTSAQIGLSINLWFSQVGP